MPFDPIALAQTSPDSCAFETSLLDALEREVGFDAAFVATKDGTVPTTVAIDPNALAASFARAEDAAEELPIKHAALAARGVAVDTDVLGESAVRKMRYHRTFAAPIGGRHSLIAYMTLRGGVTGALMLGRCGATFDDKTRRFVEAHLPAIAVARASFGNARNAVPATPRMRDANRQRSFLGAVLPNRSTLRASVPLGDGALVVRDRDGVREMIAVRGDSEMVWSRASLADPARSGWPYVDLFHVAAALAQHRRRALFIGCGGGVALHQFARIHPGIAIDVVESVPAVIALARTWFALDEVPSLSVHEADGAHFLCAAKPESWDVIVVDAYGPGDLAEGFASRPFFASLARALTRGGAVAFNVVGTLSGPGPVRDVIRAFESVLGDVRVVPVMIPNEAFSGDDRRNVIVVATRARSARESASR